MSHRKMTMPRTAKKTPPPVYPKLNLPTNRGQILERPRLTAAYAAHRAIAFIAPAGAGKTTLALQWAEAFNGAVIWLSLTAEDDRPRTFWAFALGLLQIVAPAKFEQTVLALAQAGDRIGEPFVDGLRNELSALGFPVALVIDEAQFIQNPALTASLEQLLDGLPETVHILFAGRSLTERLLVRVQAQVRDQLAFTDGEAAQVLSLQAGRPLDTATITRVVKATEGWAMGVKLAGLALQGEHPALDRLTDYSVRYLMTEALLHIPAEQVAFIERTCFVSLLTPSLCAALTDIEDSLSMLETLVSAGLFITRVKETPPQYRYHPLFREMLLERVKQAAPDVLAESRRRAAIWYAAHEQFREAAAEANACGDTELTGQYMLEASRRLVMFEDPFAFRDWLRNFPSDRLDEQPRLRLFVLMTAMQADRDAAAAQEQLRRLQSLPDANRWQGEIALGKVFSVWLPGQDLGQYLPYIEKALRVLPHDGLYAYTCYLASLAHADRKDQNSRLRALEEEYRVAHEFDSPQVQIHAINGLCAVLLDAARFEDVLALTGEGLKLLSASPDHWGRFAVDAGSALRIHQVTALLQRGMVDEAAETLRPAFAHVERMNAAVLWRLYCRQAEVHALRHDYPAMQRAINHALMMAPVALPPAAGLTLVTEAYRARQGLRLHNTRAARIWLKIAPPTSSETMYITGTAHTTAHARIVVGDYDRALSELEAEAQAYTERGRTPHVAHILALKALAYSLKGDHAAAQHALGAAIEQALPTGNVLALALTALLPLLRERIILCWEDGQDADAEFLRQPILLLGEDAPSLPLSPLTPAEQQVADMLLQGYFTQDVTAELGSSETNVRNHIRHMHKKFCTHTREQLLERLRTLHLGDGGR